jgi:hypothetical protein
MRKDLFGKSIRVIFFVVSIFLIAFSLGFAFGLRPKLEGDRYVFEDTGFLEIQPQPQDKVAVFLNDLYVGQAPISESGMPIAKLGVRLEKSNFRPWQQEILIDSEYITQIRPLLIPKNLTRLQSILAQAENVYTDELSRGLVVVPEGLKTAYIIDFIVEEEFFEEFDEQVTSVNIDQSGVVNFTLATGQKHSISAFTPDRLLDQDQLNHLQDLQNENSNCLLLIRGTALWRFYLDQNEAKLIYDFGQTIESTFWYPDTDAIIVVTAEAVWLIDERGSNRHQLFAKSPMAPVFFLGGLRKIIYLDDETWKELDFKLSENDL